MRKTGRWIVVLLLLIAIFGWWLPLWRPGASTLAAHQKQMALNRQVEALYRAGNYDRALTAGQQALKAAGVPFVLDHASGHAPVADLRRLTNALHPTRLVPIHTDGAGRYAEFFDDVEIHADGEWWKV